MEPKIEAGMPSLNFWIQLSGIPGLPGCWGPHLCTPLHNVARRMPLHRPRELPGRARKAPSRPSWDQMSHHREWHLRLPGRAPGRAPRGMRTPPLPPSLSLCRGRGEADTVPPGSRPRGLEPSHARRGRRTAPGGIQHHQLSQRQASAEKR